MFGNQTVNVVFAKNLASSFVFAKMSDVFPWEEGKLLSDFDEVQDQ